MKVFYFNSIAMDDKKKYNKALERARVYRDNAKAVEEYSAVARYENIFPELRESEDERIRKKCIELIKRVIPSGDSHSQESKEILDCIAYLEKQKEQKPDIELIQRSWYMEGYHDREFGQEPKWIMKTGEGGPKYEENPKYGQPLAEEQKPAEKQDYSGLNDLERAILRGFLVAGVENVPVTIIKETAQDCLVHIPADWSEEDEKQLDDIISIIRGAYEHGITISETRHRNAYFWLNNLRPSWKPSEEQMYVIEGLISRYRHCWDEDTRKTMELLYEDLKRL